MGSEEDLRSMLREGDSHTAPELRGRVMARIQNDPRPSALRSMAAAAAVVVMIAVGALAVFNWGRGPIGGPPLGPGRSASPSAHLSPIAPTATVESSVATDAAPITPDPGSLQIATTPPDAPGMDALGIGKLAGKSQDGIGCFWLISPSGLKTALVWPFGFTAGSDPLEVLGGDGQLIAEPGDQVELGGGSFPNRAPTPGDDPCDIGTAFIVSTVAAVNGVQLNVGAGSLKLDTRALGELTECRDAPTANLTVAMIDGKVEVMLPSGASLPATWPAGFSAHWGNRVGIADGAAKTVMTQGVRDADVRALLGKDRVDICGFGSQIYP